MKKILILILIFVGLFAVGCGGDKDSNDIKDTVKKVELLKDFALNFNDGSKIIINQKERKTTQNQNVIANSEEDNNDFLKDFTITSDKENMKILYIFTTWCEPCVGIFPHLENLKKQFGDKISFVGIPIDDIVGEVEDFSQTLSVFTKEYNPPFPLALGDERAKFINKIGAIKAVPLIVLYDKNGKYIIHYLGVIPEEMMEFDISHNLSK